MSADDKANKFDLIDVNGPLTVESILRCLQQRFSNKQYYVSESKWFLRSYSSYLFQ